MAQVIWMQNEKTEDISLRFLKRLAIIETFPEAQKKRILRNLDDNIEANERKDPSSRR
jgi:hypothetical protein